MPKITNFVKDICTRIAAVYIRITKRMYREMAVITLGACVIAVTSFASTGFGGGGKNVVMANIEGSDANSSEEDKADISVSLSEADTAEILTAQIAVQESESQAAESDNHLTQELQEDISNLEKEFEKHIDNFEQLREEAHEYERQKELEEEKKRYIENICTNLGIQSYSDEDYLNLCRIIQSEAGICDTEGKILVGNVIVNRVRSNKFPNTITEVIFYPGQFTPVSDGSFYTYEVTQHTKDAVERLLNGEDYSQGALFFMSNKGTLTRGKRWIRNKLTFLFEHQGHEFYK